MALTKVRTGGITADAVDNTILDLADDFAFSGTVTGAGGVNTPSFLASRTGSNQTITANTWTKVQFNDELLDTNNMYDHTTNYRFTPTVAGKYYIFANIYPSTTNTHIYGAIFFNGAGYFPIQVADASQGGGVFIGNIITFNGSGNYVEAYTYHGTGTGGIEDASQDAVFGGYKLIGV